MTISCSLLITFVQLIYFGSSYSLGTLDSNLYLTTLIVGGSENLANLLGAFSIDKIPRKKGIFFFHLASVLLCISFWAFDTHNSDKKIATAQIALSALVRIFNILTSSLFAIYINEAFPTSYRTIASGFIFSVSILGSFAAPYISPLSNYLNTYPIVVLGLIGSLGCICPYFF